MKTVPSPSSDVNAIESPPLSARHGSARETNGADAAKSRIPPWEIIVFGIICLADMLSTIYWYKQGVATEANPLLAYWLRRSVTAFCIAKLASFLPLLVVCAYYRNSYRGFIIKALRIAMAAYVMIYLFSVAIQFIS